MKEMGLGVVCPYVIICIHNRYGVVGMCWRTWNRRITHLLGKIWRNVNDAKWYESELLPDEFAYGASGLGEM